MYDPKNQYQQPYPGCTYPQGYPPKGYPQAPGYPSQVQGYPSPGYPSQGYPLQGYPQPYPTQGYYQGPPVMAPPQYSTPGPQKHDIDGSNSGAKKGMLAGCLAAICCCCIVDDLCECCCSIGELFLG